MNILLVGLGRWGEKHLRVLGDLGVGLWVADVSTARLAWAVRQGVEPGRAVADYRAALDARRRSGHRHVGGHALRNRPRGPGRRAALLHRKAARPNGRGGARARSRGQRRRRLVQVGHIFRFHPVTATLREALAAGRIGRVRYATGRFSGFKRPRADVGVTQTDAIHYFDLFAHLLGCAATGSARFSATIWAAGSTICPGRSCTTATSPRSSRQATSSPAPGATA